MSKIAYLALGSNVGTREEALQEAINRLHKPDLRIKRMSSVYETKPVGMAAQDWFLNMALEMEADIPPMRLLQRALNIEKEMGRKRTITKGPRTIDIDILLYGRFVIDRPRLQVPHPRMHERRFVLEPLAELAPELRHPGNMRTMRELLAESLTQKVHKAAFQPVLIA